MSFEEGDFKEKKTKSSFGKKVSVITIQKAIDMGEYNPDYLATFPEWHSLTRHVQFEFIRRALDNRRKQLVVQWAEINNVLDFSLKPHLQEALRNIEKQLNKLDDDWEKLYLEYSS
jgi:hypothetical protein